LFDIDGTLVESSYFHATAWWRAFRQAGEEIAMFKIHRLIGMGADKLIEELLGEYRQDIDDSYSEEFSKFHKEVAAFPKVAELLAEVSKRGAKVVLATSAKADQIDHLTGLIGADEAIDEIISSKDVDESKPAPDIFQTALDRAGLDPSAAIALGDAVWDVEAASKCGVKCVGLLTGGISEAELTSAGAIAVYEDPEDLLNNLDDSPIGKLIG